MKRDTNINNQKLIPPCCFEISKINFLTPYDCLANEIGKNFNIFFIIYASLWTTYFAYNSINNPNIIKTIIHMINIYNILLFIVLNNY
jgi:hypothetical protein